MDLNAAIAQNRANVEAFIAETEKAAGNWNTPVRPGKWSPAQVAEHIALSYTESASVAKGAPEGRFPNFPFFLRPLAKMIAFDYVLKNARFPRPVKTFKGFEPVSPAKDPAAAAARLRNEVAAFEATVRATSSDRVKHPAFGSLPVADYVVFQGHHTQHHLAQLRAT